MRYLHTKLAIVGLITSAACDPTTLPVSQRMPPVVSDAGAIHEPSGQTDLSPLPDGAAAAVVVEIYPRYAKVGVITYFTVTTTDYDMSKLHSIGQSCSADEFQIVSLGGINKERGFFNAKPRIGYTGVCTFTFTAGHPQALPQLKSDIQVGYGL